MINFLVSLEEVNRNEPLFMNIKEMDQLKDEREKILKFLKKDTKEEKDGEKN